MGRHRPYRWLAVAVWIAVIFAAIPFVGRLRDEFVAHWPAEFLAYGVMAAIAASAAAAVLLVYRHHGRIGIADLAWFAGLAAILIVWSHELMGQPEEAVHIVEYGILGVLVYRALRPHMNDPGVFVAAALIGILVGTADEIIQWVVPGRHWDFRDLAINGGASILVQIGVWRLAAGPFATVSVRSLRFLCRLASLEMLILTLCLAATPSRLYDLSQALPMLRPLAGIENALAEYGFRHQLDQHTVFRSRWPRSRLEDFDRQRSHEIAPIIDLSRQKYRDYLSTARAPANPFIYEARVHVFSRNRSFATARKLAGGSPEHRRLMTAAARENRILEQVFGRALARTKFAWPAHRTREVEAAANASEFYVSRVGRHLITVASERHLRWILLALVLALAVTDLTLGRRARRMRNPASAE